jgi:hypothetical protein
LGSVSAFRGPSPWSQVQPADLCLPRSGDAFVAQAPYIEIVVLDGSGALGGDGASQHSQSQRRPSREGLEAHPCGGFFLNQNRGLPLVVQTVLGLPREIVLRRGSSNSSLCRIWLGGAGLVPASNLTSPASAFLRGICSEQSADYCRLGLNIFAEASNQLAIDF